MLKSLAPLLSQNLEPVISVSIYIYSTSMCMCVCIHNQMYTRMHTYTPQGNILAERGAVALQHTILGSILV